MDDPVAHHGVEETLLAVFTHEVHEARAEGLWKRARVRRKGHERLQLAGVLYRPEQRHTDHSHCYDSHCGRRTCLCRVLS